MAKVSATESNGNRGGDRVAIEQAKPATVAKIATVQKEGGRQLLQKLQQLPRTGKPIKSNTTTSFGLVLPLKN